MEFNILVIDDKALKLWLLTLIWSAEPTMIVVNWCFPLLLMTMMLKDKPEKFVKMEKIGNGILLLNMGITLKNCNNLH
jgi:hypothetical protein